MFAFSLMILAAATAGEPVPASVVGTEASIPFVQRRALRDFVPDPQRDDGVYLQDQRKNWYYARLAVACPELRWAIALGANTRGTNRLDRYSDLIVRGDRCGIDSLTHSAAPPTRSNTGGAKGAR